MTDQNTLLAALADLASSPDADPAMIDKRLGLPPGFTSIATAVYLALMHTDPRSFLEAAAAVHHAIQAGEPIVVTPQAEKKAVPN